MRDIVEEDFMDVSENNGSNHQNDIEKESPKIVDRSRHLLVSLTHC